MRGDNDSTGELTRGVMRKIYLRVLVKKFLHKQKLKEFFRVISGDEENTLKVKERKLAEEE